MYNTLVRRVLGMNTMSILLFCRMVGKFFLQLISPLKFQFRIRPKLKVKLLFGIFIVQKT